MMSSQSNDEGDCKPPEGISQAPSAADSARNAANRGLIFSDLGEAHRKITARQASGGTLSNKGPHESNSSRDNSQKTLSTLTSDRQPAGVATAGPQNAGLSKYDTPIAPYISATSEPPKFVMPSSKEEPKTLANVLEQKVTEPKAVEPFNDSGNTVERILDQYAAYPIDRPDDSSRQQGIATRCGFRGEQTYRRGTKHSRFQADSLLRNPPQGGLPSTPRHRRSRSATGLRECSPSSGDLTVSDSQHLLNPDAQADQLQQVRQPFFPSPLHLPLKRNAKKPELLNNDDFFDATESSFDNTSNGSNNDPFRYDRHRYQPVLRPTKERDVSRALKRASKVGGCSEATIVTPEGSPYVSREPMPDIPSRYASSAKHGKRPEIRYPIHSESQARDIRVVINDKLKKSAQEDFEPQKVSGLTHENIKANNQQHNLTQDDSTADGDWVTEVTTNPDRSYVTTNPDRSYAEPAEYQNTFKATGSSVANYSDTSEGKWTGMLDSCRRALQHPAGRTPTEGYELRDLKDTNQSILLPKTRPVGIGAFPDNSNRVLPANAKDRRGHRQLRQPPLSRALANPFGNNYHRADLEGNFSFNLGRNGPSKYDFRDSLSEYSAAVPRDQTSHLQLSGTHDTLAGAGLYKEYPHGNTQRVERGLPSADYQPQAPGSPRGVYDTLYENKTRLVDEDYPARYDRWWNGQEGDRIGSAAQSSFSGAPTSIKSKFTFDLIPLEEAQIRNKIQRESGEVDGTETGNVRYEYPTNDLPGRPLPEPPKPIYARRGREAPQIATNFSPLSRRSYGVFKGKIQICTFPAALTNLR